MTCIREIYLHIEVTAKKTLSDSVQTYFMKYLNSENGKAEFLIAAKFEPFLLPRA